MTAERRDATPEERERIRAAAAAGRIEIPEGAVLPRRGPITRADWEIVKVTVTASEVGETEDGTLVNWEEEPPEPGVAYTITGVVFDFAWQTKGAGFGHTTFFRSHDDGTWRVDREGLPNEFIQSVFAFWLAHTFDDIRPRINPDPHGSPEDCDERKARGEP
jgi:hypothetical protein